MTILSFELKKLLFSKRFLYTLLVLVLLVVGVFVQNIFFQDLVEDEEKNKVTAYTQEVQKNLRELSSILEQTPEDENSKLKYQQLGKALNKIYAWNEELSSENWRVPLTRKKEFFEELLLYKELQGEFSTTTDEIKQIIAVSQHHLQVDIEPQSERYSIKMPNFLKLITSIYVNLGAIVLVLLLVGDSLTSEFEQRSIQFLYTQPVKKHSIIHAKFITAIIAYAVITFVVYFAAWITAYFLGKAGSYDYPILLNLEGRFEFITIREYIVWSLIAITLSVLMVVALNFFISLLVKNTIVTLLITLLIIVVGYFGLQYVSASFIDWLNPFAFTFAGMHVLKVKDAWINSIYITVGVGVLFYILTLLKLKRTHV
mgnify:FL=1